MSLEAGGWQANDAAIVPIVHQTPEAVTMSKRSTDHLRKLDATTKRIIFVCGVLGIALAVLGMMCQAGKAIFWDRLGAVSVGVSVFILAAGMSALVVNVLVQFAAVVVRMRRRAIKLRAGASSCLAYLLMALLGCYAAAMAIRWGIAYLRKSI